MACKNLKRSKKQRFNEGIFVGLGIGVGMVLCQLLITLSMSFISGLFRVVGL